MLDRDVLCWAVRTNTNNQAKLKVRVLNDLLCESLSVPRTRSANYVRFPRVLEVHLAELILN